MCCSSASFSRIRWRNNATHHADEDTKSERRGSVATILSMPKWGLAMKTGLVVEWLKRPGDSVQEGEPIVQIESEKATNEVEAPATGMVRWLGVPEGEDAPVGAALAVIVVPGEELTDEQV